MTTKPTVSLWCYRTKPPETSTITVTISSTTGESAALAKAEQMANAWMRG